MRSRMSLPALLVLPWHSHRATTVGIGATGQPHRWFYIAVTTATYLVNAILPFSLRQPRQPGGAGIIEYVDETSWPSSTRWLRSHAGRHGRGRDPPALSGNERRDLSHTRIAGRDLAVLLAGRTTFPLCAGRGSGALAAACGH